MSKVQQSLIALLTATTGTTALKVIYETAPAVRLLQAELQNCEANVSDGLVQDRRITVRKMTMAKSASKHIFLTTGDDADKLIDFPVKREIPSVSRLVFNSKYETNKDKLCHFSSSSTWKAYEELHATHRKSIERGETAPVLIWRCCQCSNSAPCMGVGDQLRGLSSALYTAMALGRALLVDWHQSDFDINSLFERSHIDVRAPLDLYCSGTVSLDEHYTHGRGLGAWLDVDWSGAQSINASCLTFSEGVHPSNVNWSTAWLSGWLNRDVRRWVGCAVNFMLLPSLGLRNLVLSHAPKDNYIVLHLRFGDAYLPRSGTEVRIPQSETILIDALNCTRTFLNQRADTTARVVVLSDDMEAKRRVMNSTWLTQLGWNQHQISTTTDRFGRPVQPEHASKASSSRAIYDIWTDGLIIAASDGVLLTNGGFALQAAEVGLLPDNSVWIFEPNGRCGLRT